MAARAAPLSPTDLLPSGEAKLELTVGWFSAVVDHFLNASRDPSGLAPYVEPSIKPDEHGLKTKILAPKNILEGQPRTVININFEDAWTNQALTPPWSVGLEFANERVFDGFAAEPERFRAGLRLGCKFSLLWRGRGDTSRSD